MNRLVTRAPKERPPRQRGAWRRHLLALLYTCALWASSQAAHADADNKPAETAQSVAVYGISRTRLDTVLELLPRSPPNVYTDAELIEFTM